MQRKYVLLLLILSIGFLLRFYKLGDVPAGLHRDEAFLGYNAYSILKTGRDMSGNFLPLHLQAFLYSPAGYSYFSVPFVEFFGLNTYSVRFASAFFGTITILSAFFLSKEMFSSHKYSTLLSLGSAFFLAISPWHINLSRTATENTLVVFFISIGMLFLLKWRRSNYFYNLLLSFLSFGVTFLVYQAPRAFLPIFLPICFTILFYKKYTKQNVISFLVFFVILIVIPLVFILSSKELSLRIRTVNVFNTEQTQLVLNEQIREDGVYGVRSLITRVFHNKIIGYSTQVLENYFSHLSYNFLFTDKGYPDRYRVPLSGLLYLYELPLLFIGLFSLLRHKTKESYIVLLWFFLAPLGSALTFDDIPNLQRTLLVFPAISIIIAFGILEIVKRGSKKYLLLPVIGIVMCYQVAFYLHQYYFHYNVYRPWYRNDGYKNLVAEVSKLSSGYEKVTVTNRESAPTIFFLFYTQYNPVAFQRETKNKKYLDFDRISYGKYEFSEEECPIKTITRGENGALAGKKGILYVNSGLCKTVDSAKELKNIMREDGSKVFTLLEKI